MFFVWIFFFWEDSESTGGSSCGGARPRRAYELCDRGSFGDRSLRMGLDFIFSSGWRTWGRERTKKKVTRVSLLAVSWRNQPNQPSDLWGEGFDFFLQVSLLHSINQSKRAVLIIGEAFRCRFNYLFFKSLVLLCVFFFLSQVIWALNLSLSIFPFLLFLFIFLLFLECTETPSTSTTYHTFNPPSLPLQTSHPPPPPYTQIRSSFLDFFSQFLHFLALIGWTLNTSLNTSFHSLSYLFHRLWPFVVGIPPQHGVFLKQNDFFFLVLHSITIIFHLILIMVIISPLHNINWNIYLLFLCTLVKKNPFLFPYLQLAPSPRSKMSKLKVNLLG